MPRPLPEYGRVVEKLKPVLFNLPGKIVAIDGRDGAGKTTLGRYLAWAFNSSLIETDLFIKKRGLNYRHSEISRLIERRLRKPRPVIIEGVAVLKILENVGKKPDYLIYWENKNCRGSDALQKQLEEYERQYQPKKAADQHITADVPK